MAKQRNTLRRIIAIVAGAVFLFAGYKVYQYLAEVHASRQLTDSLIDAAVCTQAPSPTALPATVTPSPTDSPIPSAAATPSEMPSATPVPETPAPQATPAPEYAPLTVDFAALHAQNDDIVGWIYCPDTPINYPIVQAVNNRYYLYRLLDGSWNSAGSLFMDYRNSADFSDWNSIVFGHNMRNNSMFGCLKEFRNQDYYEAHPVMYLLTPQKDYKVELVAGYVAPNVSAVYGFPEADFERDELIASAIADSSFRADVSLPEDARFLTLSTCTQDFKNARYIVIGLLSELDRLP
ncbi:MAG: class B sortase [Clostridia bacterium]|nr:class B sortase [Clostridia bacterium]